MENQTNNGARIDPFVFTNTEKQAPISDQVPPLQAIAQPQPAPQEVQPQYQQPQPQLIQNVFVPPPVFETNDIDDSNDFSRETLIFDKNNEHMALLTIKEKEKFKHTEAPDERFGVRVNNRHSIKRITADKILSNGCARLARVYRLIDEYGNESPLQCEIEIICREPIGRISLPVEAILRKEKSAKNTLAKAELTFVGDGFKIWCEKFSEQIVKAKVQTEHTGFYRDENDRWCHVKAGDIALHAVDSQGTLERLGIDFSRVSDENHLRLTLFLYGICGRIFTVVRSMNVFPMATLAIVYPERSAALEDLRVLYCTDDNPPLYPGKIFEKAVLNLRDEVALISLTESDHMNRKCLETLSQHGSELTAVPMLLSENEGDFSGRNDVLRLNYNLTGIGNINGELCWAVKSLLNSSELTNDLPKKFDYFCTLVKDDTDTVGVRNLIALLLSLAESYLPRLGVKGGELLATLQRYHKYLIDSAYSSSQMVMERLKMFLVSRRDIPLIRFDSNADPKDITVFLKENMVLFSRLVFEYTAKKCGTTRTSLVSLLNDNGALRGNTDSNMRNIRFGDTTERMYALDCSVLFDVGELRPMYPDRQATVPLYKIPIGKADDYDIYFDIYPSDGKKGNNPFALITGATGTGKSTLCKTLAVNTAMLNLSVVSIGVETSALDLECNVFEPGEDIEVSVEKFFEAFCADLNGEQTDIADTALELMLEQDYPSYDDILNTFSGLVKDESGAEELISAAQKAAGQLSGFSWNKVVVDGEISQVIAQTPEEADALLLEFFNYKAKQNGTRYTLLLLDEVQDFSWDSKSPLVSKILRQGRKFGIVGIFSTQYLNADNGKNIASALKQIGTHFVFRPSDDIAALKQLGYKSSDNEARDVLNILDTGEVLAKGNISTGICPLDYPVKFIVNQDDLNDIL